jgi:hypothetical protein
LVDSEATATVVLARSFLLEIGVRKDKEVPTCKCSVAVFEALESW